MNGLYYGDNLDVLREHIATESVDLVYLDPPFNSNRSYNVIFGRHVTGGNGAAAQMQAFDDTWHWTPVTDQQYQRYIGGEVPAQVGDVLTAFRLMLGENDALAYLVSVAQMTGSALGVPCTACGMESPLKKRSGRSAMPGDGPRRVYWDACVFLAWINGEPGRVGVVDALLNGARSGDFEIITSVISITEVALASTEPFSSRSR